jgi:hypothetical protein
MTKQGYTHIIVPKALHEQLKTAAHQKQISIAQLIKQLISINVNVQVGVGINTSINTAQQTTPKQGLYKALNQQINQKQNAFNKKEDKWRARRDLNPRSPAFRAKPTMGLRLRRPAS